MDTSEGERIQHVLDVVQRRHPERIKFTLHRLDEDSAGEDAVWVWVVLDDREAAESSFTATSGSFREEIKTALRDEGVTRWPYVRFRTYSEQQELEKNDA